MIVDRYILRQVLPPLGIALVILSVLFAVFTLARFLTDASTGMLLLEEVFLITGLRWLIAQDVLIPISLYLSLVFVWGRLYQDLEMDAFAAGGVGSARLMFPMVGLALALALVVAAVSLWGRPWAWGQIYGIRANAEASAEIDRIRSSQFNRYPGGYTVFIEGIQGNGALEGVFIRQREGGDLEMLSAPRGHFDPHVPDGGHLLTLFDALAFRTLGDGRRIHGRFEKLTLHLAAATPETLAGRTKIMHSAALWRSDRPADRAELQWRLSAPVSTLLLLFAGAPLARTGPRQGRWGRLVIALVVYAVYFNLVGVARTWVEQEQLDSIVWVHVLLALFAAFGWWRGGITR